MPGLTLQKKNSVHFMVFLDLGQSRFSEVNISNIPLSILILLGIIKINIMLGLSIIG